MVDVVGLRFVTEGQKEALAALREYEQKTKTLADLQDKYVATMNRALRDEQRAQERAAAARTKAARETEQAAARETAARVKAARDAATALAKQEADERRALQVYLRYQREKEQAAKRAAAETARAAAQQAREMQALAAETDALARAYNPVMAAASAYEQQVTQLNRAHALGVLAADELEAKLRDLDAAYAAVGSNAATAQNFVNQFGSVTQIAGVKTNRFGMIAQQVGYQVGDFFIQVQSGTNAFVAFGQQATQLAGLLPGLIGAIVGIGVSIGTTLLATWDRTRKAAADAISLVEQYNTQLQAVGTSLSAIEAVRFDAIGASLVGTAREAGAQFENLLRAIEAVETRALEQSLRAPIQGLMDEMAAFEAQRSTIAQIGGPAPSVNILGLTDYDRVIQAVQILNTLQVGTREEMQAQLNLIGIQLRGSGLLTDEAEALLAAYAQQLGLVDSISAATEASVEAETAATNVAERRRLGLIDLENQSRVLTEERRNNTEALAALEEELARGEEARLAAAQAREIGLLDLALRRNALTEERRNDTEALAALEAASAAAAKESDDARVNAIAIMVQMAIERADAEKEVADEARRLAEELADSYQSALGIATVDMAAGVARAADAAAVLAERMGISLVSATRLAALSQMGAAEQRVAAGVIAGTIPPVALNSLGLTPAQQAALGGAAGALTGAPTPSPITLPPVFVPGVGGTGSGTGSGAGAAGGGSDALRKREEEVRRLYESTRTEAERYAAELGKVQQLYTSGAIDGDIYRRALEELNKKFDPFTKLVEGIANTVENELNAAFAAVLKGTASLGEALLDFASNVLAKVAQDLFAQQFAAPIAEGIKSLFPSAKGNVFGPEGVTPFANGGVVSGPTIFPFANGIGLMGEAGPEAIMPLARGSDGRLGVTANGGGSAPTVTINNYTGQEATTSTDSAGNLLIEIGRAVAQDITSGGPAYRAIRTTFGLANRLQQRG